MKNLIFVLLSFYSLSHAYVDPKKALHTYNVNLLEKVHTPAFIQQQKNNNLQYALDTGTQPTLHISPEDIEKFLAARSDYQTLNRLTAYINERYQPLKKASGRLAEAERCDLFNLLRETADKRDRISQPGLLAITDSSQNRLN